MFFARRKLKRNGERATALVTSCEERSKLTSNELRDYDYALEVHTEAGETFETQVRDKFWIAGLRPTEGDDAVPLRRSASTRPPRRPCSTWTETRATTSTR